MDTIKNRLAEALEIRQVKQIELSDKTGLSAAQINSWKNNRWQPKQTALHKMAKVLDVSELWLAGYEVPMERPLEQKKADELAQLVLLIKKDPQLKSIFSKLAKLEAKDLNMIEQLLTSITKE